MNIPGPSASLDAPYGVAVDVKGNLFFTNQANLFRLDAITGLVALVVGDGTPGYSGDDGLATVAQVNGGPLAPLAVAVDSAGNVYVADRANHCIRKVSHGVITTVAGNGTDGFSGDNGRAVNAQLHSPGGIAVDSAGNLYIADTQNNRIRMVSSGVITTVAGNGQELFSGDNGPATSASLDSPGGVAVDSAGNLYIADTLNNSIRKVTGGTITTVAGMGPGSPLDGFDGDGGPATGVQLNGPLGIALDAASNLYVAETGAGLIREVTHGVITTVAGHRRPGYSSNGYGGDGGPATSASVNAPSGVAVDAAGNLFIADAGNNRIREVSEGVINTVAGNGVAGFSGDSGPAINAQLLSPQSLGVDAAANVYVSDTANARVLRVSNGTISAVAGNGVVGFSGDNGAATSAALNSPCGTVVDAAGNLYIADTNNNRIREVSNGIITTIAGNGVQGFSGDNGPATAAALNDPCGVALDAAGNLYIADTNNNRIREVSNGIITTIAGNGAMTAVPLSGDNGPATSAPLDQPESIAVDSASNLYIADNFGASIRKVSRGRITTVAGFGMAGFSGDNGPAVSAEMGASLAIAADSGGNLYIADTNNNRIRKVSNGVIATIAGNGTPSFAGDRGPATLAELDGPAAVVVDKTGNTYVADWNNKRVRMLTPGTVPAITPGGIVPNGSAVSVIQPGSWVSVFGSDLAAGTFLWNANFPTSLGGVSVTIDNKPAYIWYADPFQINVQVPDDTTPGLVSITVTTPSGTATSSVTLATYAPSFSLLGDGIHVAGEIATPNGNGTYGTYDLVGPSNTFSYSTRPVNPGETLTLYGVGFGPTTPHVPAGQVFSGAAPTTNAVTVSIGGVNAKVLFSGITEAGLYQINLIVPPNTGSGDQPLQATVNGVQTPVGPIVTVQ